MSSTVAAAIHVLLIGGLANLVFSFALGWVLSAQRMKGPIEPLHWLLVAHTVSLQEGVMLLALSYALTFARMSGTLAIVAAWLLVLASIFQDLSGFVNWLRRTGDQFAEKSAGWRLAAVNAVLNTAGLALVVYGVVRGLW